jgi:hypothetical protein
MKLALNLKALVKKILWLACNFLHKRMKSLDALAGELCSTARLHCEYNEVKMEGSRARL